MLRICLYVVLFLPTVFSEHAGHNTIFPNSTIPAVPIDEPTNSTTTSSNSTSTTTPGNGSTPETLPTFGDTVAIAGNMVRTDQDFQDGLALDLFSPVARSVVVQQNKTPLSAEYVSGATGSDFVALQNYSYVIKTNDTAKDLIAKIEIPYDLAVLAVQDVQVSNTYVGMLAADGRSWYVSEKTRNVHESENNTRIIKMTCIDGEYMLLGRKSIDTGNIFVQYGQGETRTVNFTGGQGTQTAEFIDGLRITTQSNVDVRMNIDLKTGINRNIIPDNMEPLNSYAWVVNSTAPKANLTAEMRFPFNRDMLAAARPNGASPTTMLRIAKRALNATSGQFLILRNGFQIVEELTEDRIVVPGLTQLDGQYLLLIGKPNNGGFA